MLIHSVTPPHLLTESPPYPEMTVKPLNGGYIEGFETPEGFCNTRLCTTDLSMYLKSEYMPGGIYNQAPRGKLRGMKTHEWE